MISPSVVAVAPPQRLPFFWVMNGQGVLMT